MVRVHLITFKDESDALDFFTEYNKLVDIVKSELHTFKEEVVPDEEEIEEDQHIKNSCSTTYNDDDSSRSSSDSANDHKWGILSEIDHNIVKCDGIKSAEVISSEDIEDLFVDEACMQDWPF